MTRQLSAGPLAAAISIACCLAGCTSQGQLAKISAEKEQLKVLIESEKKLNSELAAKLQTASQRAAEAERELALREGGKGSRASSLVSTQIPGGASAASLEQWARSVPLLKYDPLQRSARVDVSITFTSDDHLTFEARRELDKVADLLASNSGSRMKARIYGVEAQPGDAHAVVRATAAAEYLKRRGVAANRVEAASRASVPLVDEEGRKVGAAGSSAVEIELAEQDKNAAVANGPASSRDDGWNASSGRR